MDHFQEVVIVIRSTKWLFSQHSRSLAQTGGPKSKLRTRLVQWSQSSIKSMILFYFLVTWLFDTPIADENKAD